MDLLRLESEKIFYFLPYGLAKSNCVKDIKIMRDIN